MTDFKTTKISIKPDELSSVIEQLTCDNDREDIYSLRERQ